jgi:arylsulfatase A
MKLLFFLLLPFFYSRKLRSDNYEYIQELRSQLQYRTKPNIIFYLADDLGPGEINQQNKDYGFSINDWDKNLIQTPNIEKLAKQSTSFHQVWAGAVCSPSRYMLFTGKIGAESDIKGNQYDKDIDMSVNFPNELTKMGYNTALIGKYGFGDIVSANNLGFNYFYGYKTHVDAHYPFPVVLYENEKIINFPENRNASPRKCVNTKKCTYSPDVFLEKSLEFIRKSNTKYDPFFLMYSSFLNHVGHWNIKSKSMTSPVNSYGIYSNKRWKKTRKAYAYTTSLIDHDIGEIMNLLEELKIENNTILIFTSDNGVERELTGKGWKTRDPIFFNGSGGRKGTKKAVFEGGINVPAIIRWPGQISAGIHNNYPWGFHDFALTLMDLVGSSECVKLKFNTSSSLSKSVSVADIWLGKKQETERNWLSSEYCEIDGCKYAIMNITNWNSTLPKLIYDKQFSAYDIRNDPSESDNLINKPEYQNIINNMKTVINLIN